jgi:hypothetical protein
MKKAFGWWLGVVLIVNVCAGCATNYSEVVRFTPTHPWDARSAAQIHADVATLLPFELAPGDFVVNKGFDGPSCWVCFGDDAKTGTFLEIMRQHRAEWKVTSVGHLRTASRPVFGLSVEPGSFLESSASMDSSGRVVTQK